MAMHGTNWASEKEKEVCKALINVDVKALKYTEVVQKILIWFLNVKKIIRNETQNFGKHSVNITENIAVITLSNSNY